MISCPWTYISFFFFLTFLIVHFYCISPLSFIPPAPSSTFTPRRSHRTACRPCTHFLFLLAQGLSSQPSKLSSRFLLFSYRTAVLCHVWHCHSHYFKKIFYVQFHIISSLKVMISISWLPFTSRGISSCTWSLTKTLEPRRASVSFLYSTQFWCYLYVSVPPLDTLGTE